MQKFLSRRAVIEKLALSPSHNDIRKAIQLESAPLPPLASGKVRVKIHFAALNFADVLLVQGKYQEKPKLPAPFGSECSGTIFQIHESLSTSSSILNNLMEGQHVMVLCPTATGAGGFADFVDVHPSNIFPIPTPMMKLETAAGFGVAAGTAHIALVDRADLQSWDLVVVTGASGGTGMYACLIAKALGCRVIATARGQEKVQFVKSLLGPEDIVVDVSGKSPQDFKRYSQELVQAVLQINKMGAQVIYDTVGGPLFKTLLKCAKWKCRLCIVGFASNNIPKIPSNILLVKNSSVVGVYWGSYFINERDTVLNSMNELFDLVRRGQLKLDCVPTSKFQWSLDDLPGALHALAAGKTYGKVLIKCSNEEGSMRSPKSKL